MKNTSENFPYYKELDINYEQALEKVTEALKEQGFDNALELQFLKCHSS